MPSILLRKILIILCPVFASLCLAYGCLPAGLWVGAGLGLLSLSAWMAARRWPSQGLAGTALILSIAAAALGLAVGGAPVPLLVSAVSSLASWDLILFDFAMADNPPSKTAAAAPQPADAQPASRLEQIHFRYLALAIGVGLLVPLSGRIIHFQIPFAGMLLLVVLAYLGLDRFLHHLAHK